jgi:tRNA-dihydrouridine synthase 1
MVENDCDAIDLNLGCPQGIARKGNYGSFLLTETELLCKIVSTLHNGLKVPVTCKIRLLPDMQDTLALCRALEDAGCQLLTVHGRTRFQNKQTVSWLGLIDCVDYCPQSFVGRSEHSY